MGGGFYAGRTNYDDVSTVIENKNGDNNEKNSCYIFAFTRHFT